MSWHRDPISSHFYIRPFRRWRAETRFLLESGLFASRKRVAIQLNAVRSLVVAKLSVLLHHRRVTRPYVSRETRREQRIY